MKPEILQLVFDTAQAGHPPHEIAQVLRTQFDLNPLQAARLAHGWSQRDAADAWNKHWPDNIKTFKSISYWETWFDSPGTGYSPSLVVLACLAEIYRCNVADLLDGFGIHRSDTTAAVVSLYSPAYRRAVDARTAGAALARANALHAEVTGRWPQLWRSLDQVRHARPGPWPQWCLLPTPATSLALGEPGPVHAISALYAWRYTRSTYIYPPDLAADIAGTPDLPKESDPLRLLREWCVHVAASAGRPGLWAYLEHDHTQPGPVLRLLIDPGIGGLDDLIPIAVPLTKPLTKVESHARRSPDRRARTYADQLAGFLALLTYPGCDRVTVTAYEDTATVRARHSTPPGHDTVWIPDPMRPADDTDRHRRRVDAGSGRS
jgi:hypothetical protein